MSSASSSVRLVGQLLVLLDGMKQTRKFAVIGATNRINGIDIALRRGGRFEKEVLVPVPNAMTRERILKGLISKLPKVSNSIDYQLLALATPGYVGADLSSLVREASIHAALNGKSTVSMEELQFALTKVKASIRKGEDVNVENISWNNIGGLDIVKKVSTIMKIFFILILY